MKESIIRQVAELERMTADQLKERWLALFGAEPPGYNRVLLVKRLAYRVQEMAFGGLSSGTRARMDAILEENGYNELGVPAEKKRTAITRPVAGTRLIRQWDGEQHEVLVTRERPAPPPAQQAPGQQPPAKT